MRRFSAILAISCLFFFLPASPIAALINSKCFHDCRVTDDGYVLIKSFEGFSPFVYKDSIGIPTIGFGHALRPGEKIKTPLMGPDALRLLEADLAERTAQLNSLITVPIFPEQFDALSSFAYNVGMNNVKRSTLLKKVNAGLHKEVHPQFLRWDKAGGEPLTGLKVRREFEANRYDSALK